MEVMQDVSPILSAMPAVMGKDRLHSGNMDDSRPTTSLPPELVALIVRYLDRKDLTKVLTLNWTWAFLAASQLWETIYLTALSNEIVFLITRSVPPTEGDVQSTRHYPTLGSGQPSEAANETESTTKRKGQGGGGSYPWPTLLPYHSMVQALHVSLSSADMIQDLNDIICCCTELRSFVIHSAIPTEDLLIRGAVSMANRDGPDPMDDSASPHWRHRKHANSARTLESTWALHGSHVPRQGDQEALAASLASQSGLIFSLLANNCPKLNRIHISGFHPVAVLGSATDLRPLPPKFDLDMYHDPLFPTSRSTNSSTTSLSSLPTLASPPLPYQSLYTPTASSAASATSLSRISHTTNIPPLPTTAAQVHCHIQSLKFVNCTIPPQYLLNMLQHTLPELTELSLTQCWRDAPLGGSFLTSLARACPRLKSVSFHSEQNHRGAIASDQVLEFLQTLEDNSRMSSLFALSASGRTDGSGCRGGPLHAAGNAALQREVEAMAEVPLGTYRGGNQISGYSSASTSPFISTATNGHHHHHHYHHHHHHHHHPHHTRDVGVQVSSGADTPLNSSSHSTSTATVTVAKDERQDVVETEDQQTSQRGPSALESLRVWFTHSILDEDILRELANKTRHPQLKFVEFGSEDPFDAGEDMLAALRRDRPEIQVSWVCSGDTGGDRED